MNAIVLWCESMSETEIIFSVKKSPEGGYEARAVGHSIFTQAGTMDELKLNIREAVRSHFDDGAPLPAIRIEEHRRILGSAKGEFTVPMISTIPSPKRSKMSSISNWFRLT